MTLLRRLQEFDQQIWELNHRLEELPQQLSGAQRSRDAQAQRVADAEAAVQAIQLQQKSKEMELGSKEAAIKKTQAQLFQVKTNKEYTALQHEIEGFKADKSVMEDEILTRLDQIEQAQQAVARQREALRQEEDALRATTVQVDDQMQRAQKELEGLQAQRRQIVPQVPAKILATYERVLENRQGSALVPVEHDACGGCHMTLPPQVIHELRMVEQLISCDSCARLLYWVEDESSP